MRVVGAGRRGAPAKESAESEHIIGGTMAKAKDKSIPCTVPGHTGMLRLETNNQGSVVGICECDIPGNIWRGRAVYKELKTEENTWQIQADDSMA